MTVPVKRTEYHQRTAAPVILRRGSFFFDRELSLHFQAEFFAETAKTDWMKKGDML